MLHRLSIPLLLALTLSQAAARTFHVAPEGDDRHRGSELSPFATLQRAQKSATPGDTILVRGGTYKIREDQIHRVSRNQAHVICIDKSGSERRPILIHARPGERPVFDFSGVKPPGLRVHAIHISGSWIHLKGISVIGVQVTKNGHTQSISFDVQGHHNTLENLAAHDSQAIGFWIGGRASHNTILNCDAYRNHDHTSGDKRGGNVDGFGYHGIKGSVGNRFIGCRAWFNSDDGFDFISAHESATVENCWAFYNGYDTGFKRLADGNGFKIGGYGAIAGGHLPDPVPRHTITRSLAVRNGASGFYANHHPGGNDWIHNSAFGNGHNFNLLGRDDDNSESIPGRFHKLINNISHQGHSEVSNLHETGNETSGNSFDLETRPSNRDFISLDDSELTAPRKPDGSLPDIRFMHLRRSSGLIDKGTDTGLPHHGRAPDPGAFELQP